MAFFWLFGSCRANLKMECCFFLTKRSASDSLSIRKSPTNRVFRTSSKIDFQVFLFRQKKDNEQYISTPIQTCKHPTYLYLIIRMRLSWKSSVNKGRSDTVLNGKPQSSTVLNQHDRQAREWLFGALFRAVNNLRWRDCRTRGALIIFRGTSSLASFLKGEK